MTNTDKNLLTHRRGVNGWPTAGPTRRRNQSQQLMKSLVRSSFVTCRSPSEHEDAYEHPVQEGDLYSGVLASAEALLQRRAHGLRIAFSPPSGDRDVHRAL